MRPVRMVMAALVAGGMLTSPGAAQDAPLAPAVVRGVNRARALLEAGDGQEARALLDSIVRAQAPGSNELAEALYWRATLAERATESERDWKRLTIEAPLSPRTADALLRLGEFEMLRGRPETARPYFTRVIQDFPASPQRVKSSLWIVRGYFDARNSGEACATLASVAGASVPEGELRLQYEELGRRCVVAGGGGGAKSGNSGSGNSGSGNSGRQNSGIPNGGTPNGGTGEAGFSVQLAAYATLAEAEASAQRLRGRGIDARVDGEVKPFRVRSGRYRTRAAAAAALAALKKQGLSGFVAELQP